VANNGGIIDTLHTVVLISDARIIG